MRLQVVEAGHVHDVGDLGDGVKVGELTIDRIDHRDQRPVVSHYRLASIVQESPDSPSFSKPAR